MRKFKGAQPAKYRFPRHIRKIALAFLSLLISYLILLPVSIPIKIAITRSQNIAPQAIFVLGSDTDRTVRGVQLWKNNQEMNLWISDLPRWIPPQEKILSKEGMNIEKVKIDMRATDTVTNFTTLVDDFTKSHLKHIYVVTSDYHMSRAEAIASIVLGSRGIIITPIVVPQRDEHSNFPWYREETNDRKQRDMIRSLLWLYTGKTGSSFRSEAKLDFYSLKKF